MQAPYEQLKKHWFFIGLLFVVLLGTNFPAVGGVLKPWISKIIFVGMLLIGLRLEFREVLASFKNWKAVSLCLGCGFVAMPLLSLLIAQTLFRNDLDMYLGVVLAGAVPTTQASSLIWTDRSKGNKGLALVLMAVSNIVGIFLSPLLLRVLAGAKAVVPVGGMIQTLFLYILLPVVLGQLLRMTFGVTEQVTKLSRVLNIFLIWASILTALSTGSLSTVPIVAVICAVVFQYSSVAALSYFSARAAGLDVADSLAVLFCSAQVTITFAAVIGFSFFGPRSILYIVVYHLFQQLMGQVTANVVERRARVA